MKTQSCCLRAALLAVITLSLLIFAAPTNAGPGYALSFNGVNQYVIVTLTNPPVADYTVSAWVYLLAGGNMTANRVGVLSATNCGGSTELTIQSLTGSSTDPQYLMLGRCGAYNAPSSTNIVPTNQWVHVAVTVSNSSLVSYFINGTNAGAWTNSSGDNLALGTNIALAANTIRTFNGMLDEVQIWNMARSQSNIQSTMNHSLVGNESGLLGYWRFDDDRGTIATNSAAAANGASNGTLVNAPTWVLSGVPFVPDAATGGAANSLTGATLSGTANPCNLPATAWFEWGTNTTYGNLTSATNLSAANTSLGVSIAISNLTSGSIYHFQLVASNSVGLATGGDMTIPPLVFNDINAGLPTVAGGSVAWGDYDNDGHLDILLTGEINGGAISRVYHNNGNGTFTWDTNAVLPGVYHGAAAWGDYDNDGRLDILLTGMTASGGIISEVYHNNGDGSFSLDTKAGLPGVWLGSGAWGDYDNDGRLDILLTGEIDISGDTITRVYHNNGDGSFSLDTNAVLPGVLEGSAAWGDYDSDGRLDILLTGVSGASLITQVYHNNGNGSFSLDTKAGLPGLVWGSVAWGDYDNDGRLDILLAGQIGDAPGNYPILATQVYHNNGDGSFSLDTNAVLTGVYQGSVAWGDYDNDGRLDILLTGQIGTDAQYNPIGISQVYHNNGDGSFSLDTKAVLPAVSSSSAAWGDFDNDGRLGILLTGDTGNQDIRGNEILVASVYRNSSPATNTPPTAPAGLSATGSNNLVTLAWAAASDLQTPAAALTYNLRVGSTPGASDIFSPESDLASGFRRLAQPGNGHEGTNALVNVASLNGGQTCYWSVQTVNSAWAGSLFAPEDTFIVPPRAPVAITLSAVNIAATQAVLQGSVNPSGLTTLSWFEWGATTNYGNITAVSFPGNGSKTLTLSNSLTGLSACAAYHYRIDAFNDLDTSLGDDQSFTTPDAARTITGCCLTAAGQFRFQFTGAASGTYTVLCSTNVVLPLSNWTQVGAATNIAPGQYQFTDPVAMTNQPKRFYRLRWQ